MNKKEALKELLINAFKMGASTGIRGSYVVEVDAWLPNFIDANKTLHDGILSEDAELKLVDEIKRRLDIVEGKKYKEHSHAETMNDRRIQVYKELLQFQEGVKKC